MSAKDGTCPLPVCVRDVRIVKNFACELVLFLSLAPLLCPVAREFRPGGLKLRWNRSHQADGH